MRAYIETSIGPIYGELKENSITFSDDAYAKLNQLYPLMGMEVWKDHTFPVEGGWVFIQMDDPYYGRPEYKLIITQ